MSTYRHAMLHFSNLPNSDDDVVQMPGCVTTPTQSFSLQHSSCIRVTLDFVMMGQLTQSLRCAKSSNQSYCNSNHYMVETSTTKCHYAYDYVPAALCACI